MSAPAAPIDLRSDTVTRPSAAMRAAMAAAEVGDDVLGEDPTVNRLQERAAAFLGKAAAVFVPSGSMANQVALLCHCRPGDDVIVGQGSHVYLYESGAGGAIAGVQFTVVGKDGLFTAADVAAAWKDPAWYGHAPTRLVAIENTHNRGGGAIFPAADVAAVAALARARGVALHLDGARLCNAAIASSATPAVLAAPFDTVSMCFSKGLGAPVGSVIAGAADVVARARRFRKMLGGGMRQSGVLAAAAEFALAHNVDRLCEDHANARALADGLAGIAGVALPFGAPQTNIVIVDLAPGLPDAAAATARLRERGVLVLPFGPRRLRLVTHLDVDRADCARAVAAFADAVRSP